MANLGQVHWDEFKRVFRYLRGTYEYSLFFHGFPSEPWHSMSIHGNVDSGWVGDFDSRRSTCGYVFTMYGGDISLMSKWQYLVTLSMTREKYMEATCACKEAICLRWLCSYIGFDVRFITIYFNS